MVRKTPLFQDLALFAATLARIWPVLAGILLTIVPFQAAVAQADDPNQVGLIVAHGDGEVVTRCIEFEQDEISGYDVLDRSGLDLNIEPSGGMGVAVCRLDGEGCTFPQEPCFCQCAGGGSDCVYWSYWYLADGEWRYSGRGASGHSIGHGSVEGWVWGQGTTSGATPPPLIPFEEICTPPSPTATSTATDTPAPSPTPTNTPEPTSTPRPPSIAYFNADRTTINAGESVSLAWDLSGAEAAYLRYEGAEEGVVAPGGKTVSPAKTTVYTLIARNEDGETVAEVTITVNPVTNTPAATPPPPATTPPAADEASSPSITPPPTMPGPIVAAAPEQPTSAPTNTPSLPPPTTPVHTPTATPTMTPSPTATPARMAAVTRASDIKRRATPQTLLRDVTSQSRPNIPVVILGVVGMVALLGGLIAMAILLFALGRGAR